MSTATTPRPASKFRFTVEDRGSIESAVVNKYAHLFATDAALKLAWADYNDAETRIYARMDELAAQELAAGQPKKAA